jgi:hypothetical protein
MKQVNEKFPEAVLAGAAVVAAIVLLVIRAMITLN